MSTSENAVAPIPVSRLERLPQGRPLLVSSIKKGVSHLRIEAAKGWLEGAHRMENDWNLALGVREAAPGDKKLREL